MKSRKNKLAISYQNPAELKLNPKNSRTHSKKQLHKIAQSIEKLGFIFNFSKFCFEREI